MGQVIKKIFIIMLIIVAIGGVILVGKRYNELKNSGKLDNLFENNKSSNKDFGPLEYIEASSKEKENSTKKEEKNHKDDKQEVIEKVEENKKDDREFIVEEKNYEGYYNTFILDHVIYLYEGTQYANGMQELVDRLIQNVDDPLYSKPDIEFKNISGLSATEVDQNNFEKYKNVLNEFKQQIGNNTYDVSFEYAKVSNIINKIIITRK